MDDQPPPLHRSLQLVGDSTVRHDGTLSYEFVPARRASAAKPPLLVLLHGGGANEAICWASYPISTSGFRW